MFRKNLLGAAVAFGVLGLGSANAAVYTLSPTPNNDNNTVAAQADITTSGDTLTIVLTNLSPSLSAPNQALSDLFINFTTDVSSFSNFTQSGSLINIAADGTTTPVAGDPDHWGASLPSGNLYLTALTGGQPDDMIAPGTIGGPNAGVLNFIPYIDTTGTFTLNISGASNLTIASVFFSFGTAPNEFNGGGECTSDCGNGGNSVPEPGTWALMIIGFGGVGGMMRLRRRRALLA